MPIVCKKCNAVNRDTARFCVQCANLLATAFSCPHCGRTIPATANFCPYCSDPLRNRSASIASIRTGFLPANTVLQQRYKIIQRVGSGGMGAVYQAEDIRIAGKCWAVKEMSDADLNTPAEKQDAIAAFRQEAQMLALLDHPNLPMVTDYFSEAGKHYLVMEFIAGETLEKKLLSTPGFLQEKTVLYWAEQLCQVLIYLHSQQPAIIFRDLKPGNVMLDQSDRVKLIDFGIARIFKTGKMRDTRAIGTPGYAAPEQYGPGQTDVRSDIYSLGVLLHQLLTHHDPSRTPFNLPSPGELNPQISPSMLSVIQKATQSKPQDRFQSVQEVLEALNQLGKAPIPVARPVSVMQSNQSVIHARVGNASPANVLKQPGQQSPQAIQTRLSCWKALLSHFFFGTGLFYVDSNLQRKWVYVLVFCYALADVLLGPGMGVQPFASDFGSTSFIIAGGIYILSFLDVFFTCRARKN